MNRTVAVELEPTQNSPPRTAAGFTHREILTVLGGQAVQVIGDGPNRGRHDRLVQRCQQHAQHQEGRDSGWGSAAAIGCYLVGAAGLGGFVAVERRFGGEALLPLRLFHNGVFSVASATARVVGMGMSYPPPALPANCEECVTDRVRPAVAAADGRNHGQLGGLRAADLPHRPVQSFSPTGTALMTVALLMLSFRLAIDTSLVEVDIYMVLFGLSNAFRATGSTPEFQSAVVDPAIRSNPANDVVLQAVRAGRAANAGGVLQDSSFLRHIDPRLARPFLVGFADAMDGVFIAAAAVLSVAFVGVLFLEELPLRNQSGIEALAAEVAAATGRRP